MFRNIITLTAIALTIGCNDVPEHEHTTTESDIVQEVSETRAQFEMLFTECEDHGNTIELHYDDVIIISATHYTNSDIRQPVDGWGVEEETGRVMIANCEAEVQVVYLYK